VLDSERSETDLRVVIDCPTCKRTIWNGATCTHGKVPPVPPSEEVQQEEYANSTRKKQKGDGGHGDPVKSR
jgi:hypothetical protein